MTGSKRFAFVTAMAVHALIAGPALAQQTKCPEGQTAAGACVNRGLAQSMRQRGLIFTQPKLSFTGAPASQSSGELQDTRAGRLLERSYNQYGPPPSQPTTGAAPAGPGPTPGPPTGGGVTSDSRLKHDIVRLNCLDNGICLYRFRYLWSDTLYVGVMAQEVERIVPAAVTRDPNGYLRVHYDRLGLTFQRWTAWRLTRDFRRTAWKS